MKVPCLFLDFKSTLKSHQMVHITWRTLSENHCNYFEIQRSSNNKIWKTLELVASIGSYNESVFYQTKDKPPLNGQSYYRIKAVGKHNEINYSTINAIYIQTKTDNEVAL